MKHVCFLIGNINSTGGTERVTSLIANELVKKGYNITILSLFGGDSPFYFLDKNIKTHALFTRKVSFRTQFLSCVWKLRNFVCVHKIDSLIVVDSLSCVFSVPALFGLKIRHICWEHFNFNVNLGVRFRDLGRKWAAKYCDYIITLTHKDKTLWESGLGDIRAKILPIANPTPYERIEHLPSLEYKTVLAIGRLTYQKGFDLLLQAWAIVCETNQDWTLKIVGGGEDELKLKQQAIDLNIQDRVLFIPPTKNVDEHYRSAAFYCMSSRFEGLPMVLLEAQAYGLPIISFDCDTGPSDVIENAYNGFLVADGAENSLAKKILCLIGFDEQQFSEMVGRSKINVNKYKVTNLIEEWDEVLG